MARQLQLEEDAGRVTSSLLTPAERDGRSFALEGRGCLGTHARPTALSRWSHSSALLRVTMRRS